MCRHHQEGRELKLPLMKRLVSGALRGLCRQVERMSVYVCMCVCVFVVEAAEANRANR